jgi:tRNA 2-thiouridine synthesizing protein A
VTGVERSPGLLVDGTGLRCATRLPRLRQAIAGLSADTVVHVVATDPAAPLDLPAWCHLVGHTYLGELPDRDPPIYALRTSAAAWRVDATRPWHPAP